MYSVKEVAERLGVSYHQASRLIKKEGLGTKVGGWAIILSSTDLERLIAANGKKTA